MPVLPDFLLSQELLFFLVVGFVAQFIDGALGMAYGISANTLLLSLGVAPVQASASIHIAELFTTSISEFAHYGFGNVDMRLVRKLILPGMTGAVSGALFLVWLPATVMKFLAGIYLLFMGSHILYKAYKNYRPEVVRHHVVPLGLFGGFLDAAGGGGWGTIVASTLVARGSIPRLAIGTVNATEFFVALASSLVFVITLASINWTIVLGLAAGGAVAAPLAAYVVKRIPARLFMVLTGIMIILLSTYIVLSQVLPAVN